MNTKEKCRTFTNEFKNDAVKLVNKKGYSCTEVSQRLGVDGTNVFRWIREDRYKLDNTTQSLGSPDDLAAEVKRLRGGNKRFLMEREIIKKAAAFFVNEHR